jgi:hypothetical protein
MLLLLGYVGRVEKSLAFLPPRMVEGHGGRMMVADTWHPLEVRHAHHPPSRPTFTEVPGKDEFLEVHIAPVQHPRPSLTAGCNEVDPSDLLLEVPRLRGTVIFRVGLLKKHLCVREVEWSNITAKR